MAKRSETIELPFHARPAVGTFLTILSGVSFLILCMILPLVGRAGTAVSYADQNTRAFLMVLVASLALGGCAVYSKLERRKIDHSPFPLFSAILCSLCLILLVAFFTGLLRI